jgi:hypothetical protein
LTQNETQDNLNDLQMILMNKLNSNLIDNFINESIEQKLVNRSQEKLLIQKITVMVLYLVFFIMVFQLAYDHAYIYSKIDSDKYLQDIFRNENKNVIEKKTLLLLNY